jgi:hypothetical protein
MTIPNFQLGYPPDGSSLGNTKLQMRDNIDGTIRTLSVDHLNANQSPPGYHTVIHQQTQTTVSTISGVNQVFSGVPGILVVNGVTTKEIPPGGDTQLYSLTGAAVALSGLSQLTGNNASANGYQWIGGVLLQWGSATTSGTATPNSIVTFPVAFPNNCLSAVCTTTETTTNRNFTVIHGFNASQLQVTAINSSGTAQSGVTFYWFAIGS